MEIVDYNPNFLEDLWQIHILTMPENDLMTKNNFVDEFSQPTRKYFVCLQDNVPVGYIGAFNMIDDYNIIGIAVKKDFQHKGVGTKLINSLIDFAKKENVKSLSLEVDETNLKAINFYKKMGFVVTNIRKKYYKNNDALIMWLYL